MHVNGLTREQQARLLLVSSLESDQKDYLIAGILGILDGMTAYEFATYTKQHVAEEILDSIDNMIAKAYEKGRYM